MISEIYPIYWENNKVVLMDQLKLPHEEKYYKISNPQEVADAITNMIVRGAGAIGVTAGYGLALAAQTLQNESIETAKKNFSTWCGVFSKTRPTAVNLFWAIDRMKKISNENYDTAALWAKKLFEESDKIRNEDLEACKAIGKFGDSLISQKANILTHCNAGALAFSGWGTALGIVRSAAKSGKKIHVYADETRPYLQGARLTAWELMKEKIPATLITDNMAGHFMSKGKIDCIIVGAGRIAKNGDVANKIGTYSLSILAKEHCIPFYVAAPKSTFDLTCNSGREIPIEERSSKEVTHIGGISMVPEGMKASHPAFDVTPHRYIHALITEFGIIRPPFEKNIFETLK